MKRTLTILAFLLFGSESAFAAPTFSQACKGAWASGTTMTVTCTYGAHHLAAIGVLVFSTSGLDEFSSIGDGGANTYTQIDHFTGTSQGSAVDALTYYVKDTAAGAITLTINFVDTGIIRATAGILEYSGTDLSAPLDGHANFNQQNDPTTAANAITSTAITPGSSGDLIVGFMFSTRGGVVNYTAGTNGAGYTTRDTYAMSMGIGEDQAQVSAASITAKATQDYSDASTDTFTAVVAFKAAGGGGGSTPHNLTLLGVGN